MADLRSGCIIFDTEFEFKDKAIGDKLLIILNNPQRGQPFLVCRTTSKERLYRRTKPKGCQQNGKYFFFEGGKTYFRKNTWLQLDEIYEYSYTDMLSKKFKEILKTKANLNDEILRQIKKCIENSQDISAEHLEMISTTIL